MDAIHLRQLKLACIIGTEPRERRRKQAVAVSVGLHGDFRKAARRDRLEDALDYAALCDRIVARVEASRFRLIETLAQAVADVCLADEKVAVAEVTVEKPGALRGRGRVSVTIRRTRMGR